MYKFIFPLLTTSILIAASTVRAESVVYDLQSNNHLQSKVFITAFQASWLPNSELLTISNRKILWSNYLGVKNNSLKISPDRVVWEVVRKYCRPSIDGETQYFFEAIDAETGKRLTTKNIQRTDNITSVLSAIPQKYKAYNLESLSCR
jgi:hypothetical protein